MPAVREIPLRQVRENEPATGESTRFRNGAKISRTCSRL